MEITFETLADTLLKVGINESPSDLHGMACGRLSGGQTLNEKEWLAVVAEHYETEPAKMQLIASELMALYQLAGERLQDTGFGFELLLPDDDYELTQRLESLGCWCQGYLVGLGLSGISSDTQFSADAADGLKDLAQIAQIDPQEADSEEGEVDFTEVVEYVRMAVLLIRSEIVTPDSETPAGPTLH